MKQLSTSRDFGTGGRTKSRYIDADALTWLVEEYKLAISPITEEQELDNRLPLQMLTEFENMIDEQPTVDAVPVVRCRECKYCYSEGFVNVRNVCEKHYDFGNVDDDWFCADAERKRDR